MESGEWCGEWRWRVVRKELTGGDGGGGVGWVGGFLIKSNEKNVNFTPGGWWGGKVGRVRGKAGMGGILIDTRKLKRLKTIDDSREPEKV